MTVKEIAALIGGTVEGDKNIDIKSIKPIEEAGPEDLTFVANPKYLKAMETSRAAAAICNKDISLTACTAIKVANAYLGFARIMQHFHPRKRKTIGVHPQAYVSENARIGQDVNIYPGAYIGDEAVIGDRVDILPGCFIGDQTTIGEDTLLYANVTIYHACRIGARVIVHSGTVIGSDGYGFASDEQEHHHKIPQVGCVIVEDDVEIGSNCSIDRAVMGATRIGQGTKLDNLIQVAHNVQIGKHCFIVSQVGISGSSKIGSYCKLAGQVGVVGHIEVEDRCIIAAQSGVHNNVKSGEIYLGSPARPMSETRKIFAIQAKLPEIRNDLRKLKKRVEEMENKAG